MNGFDLLQQVGGMARAKAAGAYGIPGAENPEAMAKASALQDALKDDDQAKDEQGNPLPQAKKKSPLTGLMSDNTDIKSGALPAATMVA